MRLLQPQFDNISTSESNLVAVHYPEHTCCLLKDLILPQDFSSVSTRIDFATESHLRIPDPLILGEMKARPQMRQTVLNPGKWMLNTKKM